MSKLVVRLGVPLLAVLALAGCGSSNKSSTVTSTKVVVAKTPTVYDAAIAAKVPAAIKSLGVLNIGTEAQYAPNEFVAPDGHTIIGMDPDLVNAMAAVMGLRTSFHNATFESIIPGLQAGRYQIGASSFTDTKEREKSVDFVTYFQAGISFYENNTSNSNVSSVQALCGHAVALEKGTTEQEEAEKQSKTCTKEGKKAVTVLSFPGQNPVNLAVASGRAELGMADSPVVAYQIAQSGGHFKLLCKCYGFAPYGFAVPKNSGMAQPMLEALKKVMASGAYTQILTKWGIQSGAITEPKINGATS
jgi:polar amino acid transport system substrate-binding protein